MCLLYTKPKTICFRFRCFQLCRFCYNVTMYYVYILTNANNSVFYVGVTGRIVRRVFEHKGEILPGFTRRYQIKKLLYYEGYTDIRQALAREKS